MKRWMRRITQNPLTLKSTYASILQRGVHEVILTSESRF